MSESLTILIAGCGDVGTTLGRQLAADGHRVYGLRRDISKLPPEIKGISADLSQPDKLKLSLSILSSCDLLVYSAATSAPGEEGYRSAYVDGPQNLLSALPVTPKQIFFTSSTGVYHQDNHGLVDETSPCQPTGFRGQLMLQAEQQLLQHSIPATIVRFSGIYGPGRNHLLSSVLAGKVAPESPTHFSNRIHRDDCAGVLLHLINRWRQGLPLEEIYLASDDCPVSMQEITHWLAKQLKVTVTEHHLARRAGSKRCSNARLKATGYEFKFPDYRTGYAPLLPGPTEP
ncbi:SDR family oxidoreductase [Pontibacter sp. JAM-7]|uniref:SDR family oxidoreductase n=1 Tax=Pontibacter sp. JAM-7 TaxID=3366581 RepID=UPI003AF449E7